MSYQRISAVALGITLGLSVTLAHAQGRSSAAGPGSSLFGSSGSSFGGSGAGGMGQSGGSAFGGGQAGRGGFGQGGLGQGGLGGGGLGQGGLGQSLGFGAGGQTGGNSAFIGNNSADVSQFLNALNPMSGQAGGRGEQTRGAMDRGRGANAGENTRPPVLVNVSLGFDPPARPAEYSAAGTTVRLNDMLTRSDVGDARITVEGGVAVISGRVSSESERLMLTRLARLEPGVSSVEDRTTSPGELPELRPVPEQE